MQTRYPTVKRYSFWKKNHIVVSLDHLYVSNLFAVLIVRLVL